MAMMSMRLPDDLTNQLDVLANATGRSKFFLAGQAIRDFIDQIAEITQAISEADKGEFATDAEMNSVGAKWKHNAG